MFPRSAFGQTVFLVAALLLINQIVSYVTVSFYVVKPTIEQVNLMLAKQIKTVFIDWEDGVEINDEVSAKFFEITGIEVMTQREAMRQGLGQSREYSMLSRSMTEQLGGYSRVRISQTDPLIYWVEAPQAPGYWVKVPLKGFKENNLEFLTFYLSSIGFLSVLGGWLFARHLNRPLKALQQAAVKVGKGDFSTKLEEEGSTEVIEVTRAFNQMSRGIAALENDRRLLMADEDDYLREGIIYDIEDMNGIIDQFIEYLRHHKREELSCEDINALVAEVVNSELQHQRTITFKSNPNIGNIPLSSVAIKRVITNMIGNALRYSEGDIEVLSYFNSNKKYVVIAVNDSGPGIPENELESVFEPFKQGDAARGSEGSGLGLAIIKRIVDIHDGKVKLENRPEGGLSAQVYLPIKVSTPA